MKILSVVGARPQFIKAAVLSAEFARRGIDELIVHTGQHYDHMMSDVFFDELALAEPAYRLEVGSNKHGAQTGEMMKRLEPIVEREAPDAVLVYGDTNSTLAGALVAAKLRVPLAHVEAGLRSFDRAMPEETNRVVADHVSTWLFAPGPLAATNLAREGIVAGVHVVGDLMIELVVQMGAKFSPVHPILKQFAVTPDAYAVATIHRAANTDDPATFERLIDGLRRVPLPVIFPVHPRTAAIARRARIGQNDNIRPCDPLAYGDLIALVKNARVVLTDSGGLQKEAVALGVRCVTLRNVTEWTETLASGWNALAGSDPAKIEELARRPLPRLPSPYAEHVHCAARIADVLLNAVSLTSHRPEVPAHA